MVDRRRGTVRRVPETLRRVRVAENHAVRSRIRGDAGKMTQSSQRYGQARKMYGGTGRGVVVGNHNDFAWSKFGLSRAVSFGMSCVLQGLRRRAGGT